MIHPPPPQGRIELQGYLERRQALAVDSGLAWAAVILTAYSGAEYVFKAWPVLTGRDSASRS